MPTSEDRGIPKCVPYRTYVIYQVCSKGLLLRNFVPAEGDYLYICFSIRTRRDRPSKSQASAPDGCVQFWRRERGGPQSHGVHDTPRLGVLSMELVLLYLECLRHR